MSAQNAARFLFAATHDQSLRNCFTTVQSPDEFVDVSRRLGYQFSQAELKTIVCEHSQDVLHRRSIGVWKWLRDVNWM